MLAKDISDKPVRPLGTVTTFFVHPPQPGITTDDGRMLPRRDRLATAA